EEIKHIFSEFDAIVGVMAAGILIRAVAPLLGGKLSDPAVVCVDVSGRFAVSLLSGHYGGANQLAKLIADGIGAMAVITTASEVVGRKSVEEVARSLHCKIVNPKSLVDVNALIVDGREIVVTFSGFSNQKVPGSVCGYGVRVAESLDGALGILKEFDGGILVTRDGSEALKVLRNFPRPVAVLEPKAIVVGIGARKEVCAEEVSEAVNRALEMAGVPAAFALKLATVDIKRDSEGIADAGNRLNLPIQFISVDALREFDHRDLSPDAEAVRRRIGVGGVCERAALIAAGGKARLILRKVKMGRVTVAVAEAE
ncbi:MAG: cobalamin biosynthesis protein, partial [Candidatus Bathyarchaeia archaeon]